MIKRTFSKDSVKSIGLGFTIPKKINSYLALATIFYNHFLIKKIMIKRTFSKDSAKAAGNSKDNAKSIGLGFTIPKKINS